MHGSSIHTHSDTAVVSVAAAHAPEVVTSAWIDEQLSDTYERTGLHPGVLAEVGGVMPPRSRRWCIRCSPCR